MSRPYRFLGTLGLSLLALPFWILTRDAAMAAVLSRSYGAGFLVKSFCVFLTLGFFFSALGISILAVRVSVRNK